MTSEMSIARFYTRTRTALRISDKLPRTHGREISLRQLRKAANSLRFCQIAQQARGHEADDPPPGQLPCEPERELGEGFTQRKIQSSEDGLQPGAKEFLPHQQ